VVEGVVHAITEAIGSYTDARDAVQLATNSIRTAMDEINLPDHLPTGVSPVSVVNTWEDEEGPLSGSTLEDYDAAFDDLNPPSRRPSATPWPTPEATRSGHGSWPASPPGSPALPCSTTSIACTR